MYRSFRIIEVKGGRNLSVSTHRIIDLALVGALGII